MIKKVLLLFIFFVVVIMNMLAQTVSFTENTANNVSGNPTTYNITCNSTTGGTITAVSEAAEGSIVTLTVTPETGYALKTLTVADADGVAVGVSDNTFTMPSSDVTLNATFESTTKTFVLKTSGSIDVTKKYLIVYRSSEDAESGTLMSSDFTDYVIGSTKNKGAEVGSIVTISSNQIITDESNAFSFENSSTNGKYYIKNNAGYYIGNSNSNKNLEVSNSSGYDNSVTVSQSGAVTITSVYSAKYILKYVITSPICFKFTNGNGTTPCLYEEVPVYTVTCNTSGHGSVSVSPYTNVASGTTVTLTAIPDSGYELDSYMITKTGDTSTTVHLNDDGTSFTMPAYDVTITPTWTPKYVADNDHHNVTIKGDVADDNEIATAKACISTGSTDNTLVYVEGSYSGTANNVVVKNGDSYTCKKLKLTDGYSFYNSNEFTANVTEYERTSSSTWGTICLPYAPVNTSDIEYYELKSSDASSVTFEKITTPEAYKPYLFKNSSGSNYNANMSSDVTVPVTSNLNPAGASISGYKMMGAILPTSVVDGTKETNAYSDNFSLVTDPNAYYFQNSKFYSLNERFNMNGFRAYLTAESSSPSKISLLNINFIDDDNPAGIKILENKEQDTVTIIFDTAGRRLNSTQKGINIVNGRKVIVK